MPLLANAHLETTGEIINYKVSSAMLFRPATGEKLTQAGQRVVGLRQLGIMARFPDAGESLCRPLQHLVTSREFQQLPPLIGGRPIRQALPAVADKVESLTQQRRTFRVGSITLKHLDNGSRLFVLNPTMIDQEALLGE